MARSRLLMKLVLWDAERIAPGVPGEVIGRTRYIDDRLRACIDEGIGQLVILGAGLDSRAHRFEELKGGVKVFELDYPATQEVKVRRVRKLFGRLPDGVAYIPIDFDRDDLGEKLFESGYDGDLKTFFIWEGVTYYLTARAVDATLDFIARDSGEGSSIIFDYIFRSVLDGHSDVKQLNRVLKAYELLAEIKG